jgi:catechol 2,3-dioxygenase-like lactoylglutathione lyase family enzyme
LAAFHCNLNVRDLSVAARVYEEGFGMRVGMRSRAPEDSRALGLSGRTDAEAWFLYDHRGGRVAPAVELMKWNDPPTEGHAYSSSRDVGMQALGFTVPSVQDAVATLHSAGATNAVWRRPGSVADVVIDADGVPLELIEESGSSAAFRYARLVCSDLDRSADWYGTIGFEPVGSRRTVQWDIDTGDGEVDELTVALGPPSGFSLKLTSWHGHGSSGIAHQTPNHRGLIRMALRVDDVSAAATAARSGGIDASDAIFIPLPGTPRGGATVSYFRDPDGVTVEFVENPQP